MLFFYANPVLIAAAVLPAIFLLIQINKADKLDREPPGMILNLVFWGAVSTALAVYTERLGTTGGATLVITDVGELGLDELRAAWEATLPALFDAPSAVIEAAEAPR